LYLTSIFLINQLFGTKWKTGQINGRFLRFGSHFALTTTVWRHPSMSPSTERVHSGDAFSQIMTSPMWNIKTKHFHQNFILNIFCFCRVFFYFGLYSVFQGFSKAKSANGGSILSWSQFFYTAPAASKIILLPKI
jgi:hypothetical protein